LLQHILEAVGQAHPAWRFKSVNAEWVKLIDFEIPLDSYVVVLRVDGKPEADEKTSIGLEVHSTGDKTYLPQGLKLTVLLPDGEVYYEDQVNGDKDLMGVELPDGEPGAGFSVQLSLGNVSVTKDFVI
jgi:hypothetical protein